ncbi:MAG: GTPase, partial [Planctomycetota bacterium]|nr:GTPase [Planctomycetota bacterium]
KRELASIDRRRIREIDARRGLFKLCLVGYTNAGKSTLLNTLTDAGVVVEDRLFATLDTRTKKWALAKGAEVLVSDTVGFVNNLPHQLVASFKATLEEAVNADLLVHVIDAANPDALKQIDSVNNVLNEIGCSDKPVLEVLNKTDVVRKISDLETLQTLYPDAVCISAKTRLGIDSLIDAVTAKYKGAVLLLRVTCKQSNGKVQSFLRAHGQILDEQYSDRSVLIDAQLGRNQLPGLERLRPENIEIVED